MRHVLRTVATLATGALIATTTALPAQAAPADDAGSWLQSQLTDGLVHNDEFDFDDYGLTADVGLAFAELGQDEGLADVSEALAENVDAYTAPGPGEVYAGPTAKLAVLARVAGADPRSYGGVDLVQRLNRRVVAQGRNAGRIRDRSEFGDFGNTIGQAYAVPALARAGVTRKARKATRFLLRQQCSAGYFRLNFAKPARKNQACDAGKGDAKAPDTDATALAVLGLRALPRAHRTKATRGAVADAKAWLKRRQKNNGSFGGGVATEASNANSTGLAAWVLGESGSCAAARKAARWVRDLQVGDAAGTPLEGESGAVAYDRAAYNAAQSEGITVETRDQWRRATAQAAPGLRFVGGC